MIGLIDVPLADAFFDFEPTLGLTDALGEILQKSGQLTDTLGVGGERAFVSGALERSTVDLADQFSRMIITQRAYSSNAQVLRTADEMTMAARDLKR